MLSGMSHLLHPFTIPAKDTSDFVRIVSGKGAVLTLSDGRQILDGMASLWYCNVGYGNPKVNDCLLYTSPSPRDATLSRMPSSA